MLVSQSLVIVIYENKNTLCVPSSVKLLGASSGHEETSATNRTCPQNVNFESALPLASRVPFELWDPLFL